MMKKTSLFILLLLTVFNSTSFGQGGDNSLDGSKCDCYTFVDACSGKEISISGSVILSCTYWDGKPWDKKIEIKNGKFCPGDYLKGCTDPEICLNAGNWEVCDVDGCTIELFQTIPTFPTINGTLLGYGFGTPGQTGGFGSCVGQVHSGALNSIFGATDLLVCPGDEIILSIPGMSIPESSGLCLTVNIKTTGGSLVASHKFGAAETNGNTLDLTNLFANTTNQTYIIEMIMGCCDSKGDCTVNSYKYAYINVEGQFSYSLYAVSSQIGGFGGGTHVSFTPATSPYGPTVPYNIITLTGYNVKNPQGIDIDMTLVRTRCDKDSGNDQNLGSITLAGTNPFSYGPFVIDGSSSDDCECYRLDVTYDDGCGDGITTDSYYWKIGSDCFGFAPDSDEWNSFGSRSTNESDDVRVVPNPVGQTVSLHIARQYDGAEGVVEIRTIDGRLMYQKTLPLSTVLTIDSPLSGGTYLYSVKTNDKVFSGKFVKL